MGRRIIKDLKFLKECILSIVYASDEKCIICKSELYGDEMICPICEKNIKFCKNGFYVEKFGEKYNFYSAAYYSKVIMELIIQLKYKSNFTAGKLLSQYMLRTIKNNNINFDYITYVPMTKDSLKNRGYNQSKFLAKMISDEIDIPVIDCLKKIKSTKDQIGLGGNQRWLNMKDSFAYVKGWNINNKNILIVDDVITTGATAYYCAVELKKGGAGEINILTAAKSRV